MSEKSKDLPDVTGEPDESPRVAVPKPLGRLATAAICLAVIGTAAALLILIFKTEPEAKRITAKRKSAMLVDVHEVQRGVHRPVLTAMGVVKPARDIVLSPRVNGEIVHLSPEFTPGGIVQKGATLMKIDPADYENALQQRKSDERRAVADLEIEMGRQDVARKGYDLLSDNLTGENEALVLRRPQLNTARALVEASRAALHQAELDLERTTITAPFHAQVVSRNVNVGSQVSPGSELGRLVGIDTYWIEATVPQSRLPWLRFDDAGAEDAAVRIRNRSAWPEKTQREGRLDRLIGILEERSRLARVLITVDDPLLRDSPDSGLPALMIGSFVEATIPLKELPDVVRLNRNHIHRENTVWVMKDGKLDIRNVEIVYQDSDHAYIRSGLDDGDEVIVSNLATVVQGASLRVRGDNPPEEVAGVSENPASGEGSE